MDLNVGVDALANRLDHGRRDVTGRRWLPFDDLLPQKTYCHRVTPGQHRLCYGRNATALGCALGLGQLASASKCHPIFKNAQKYWRLQCSNYLVYELNCSAVLIYAHHWRRFRRSLPQNGRAFEQVNCAALTRLRDALRGVTPKCVPRIQRHHLS